jgi:hypothetical protein
MTDRMWSIEEEEDAPPQPLDASMEDAETYFNVLFNSCFIFHDNYETDLRRIVSGSKIFY